MFTKGTELPRTANSFVRKDSVSFIEKLFAPAFS